MKKNIGQQEKAEHEARMGEKRPYKFLIGYPEGKRPLGSPRNRWEYNLL
jgi:hypothetical protein